MSKSLKQLAKLSFTIKFKAEKVLKVFTFINSQLFLVKIIYLVTRTLSITQTPR